MEKREEIDSQKVLADIVNKSIKESHTKRWMWFIVTIFIISYLILGLMNSYKVMDKIGNVDPNKIPLISLYGGIGPGQSVEAHSFIGKLENAFESNKSDYVVIMGNSPGGSPAHAKIIYDRILKLKKKFNKKVIFTVEDTCASACYYVASASDQIYLTTVSMIGSIGVKMDSWDFTGAMDLLGIKNDTLHSGQYKLLISPFSKKDPEVIEYMQKNVLAKIHKEFIGDVKVARSKLSKTDSSNEVFAGLVYIGNEGIDVGLADDIGDIYSVLESINEKEGIEYSYNYNQSKNWITILKESVFKSSFEAIVK